MSYKTLVLIDNTSELTTLNREIIKETVKAFIKNAEKDNKIAVAVTGETAEYLTEYDDSLNTQLKTIDAIEYKEINAPGADVLMEVLVNWKESDVAYRDILYISGRDITESSEYTEEELFFEINDKQYPIYTLCCAQNENSAVLKKLNALSRISGGVCVSTEDAQSDAEVERQLSEKLLKAMKEIRDLEKEKLEAEDKIAEEEIEGVGALEPGDDIEVEPSENVIYEVTDGRLIPSNYAWYGYPVMAIFILVVLAVISAVIRNRKRNQGVGNKSNRDDRVLEREELNKKREHAPFEYDDSSDTVCLSQPFDNEDGGTRLLYQTKEGVEITLEDRSDPTKFFRACITDSVVIGRNEKVCEIPITYDDSISLRHCELYQRDSQLFCRDLGSLNGTMINQQKVYQEIKVESGDILRIGRLSFFVQIIGENYG